MSNLHSLPDYFSKSSTMPRCNASAFPPFKLEYRYRGVYERAGFDYDKFNPKSASATSPTHSLSPNGSGNNAVRLQPGSSTSQTKKLSSISSSNATSRHTSNCTTTSTRQTLVSLSPHNSPTHSTGNASNVAGANGYLNYAKDDDLLISTVRPRPLPEASETLSRVTLIQMSIPSDTHSLPQSVHSNHSSQPQNPNLHSFQYHQNSSYPDLSMTNAAPAKYSPFTSRNPKNLNLVIEKSNFSKAPVQAAPVPLPYPTTNMLPDSFTSPVEMNNGRFAPDGVDRPDMYNSTAGFLNLPEEKMHRLSQQLMVSSIISKEEEPFARNEDEDEDDSEINKELEMQLQQLKWTGSISSSSIPDTSAGELPSSSLKSPLTATNDDINQSSTSFNYTGVDITPKLNQYEYESQFGETPRVMSEFDDLSVEPLQVNRKSIRDYNNTLNESYGNSFTTGKIYDVPEEAARTIGHEEEEEIAPLNVKKKSPSLHNIPRFEISDNSLSDIGETLPLNTTSSEVSLVNDLEANSPTVPRRLRPVSPTTKAQIINTSLSPNDQTICNKQIPTEYNEGTHSHRHLLEASEKLPPGQGPCRGCNEAIDSNTTSKHLKPIFTSTTDAKTTLSGQWHRKCFQCHDDKCAVRFSKSTPCFIYNDQPYCFEHYSILNGTVCEECQEGIEGEYIESELQLKFHPSCLRCMQCRNHINGGESYYVHNNIIYCETDAALIALHPGDNKMERRRTRIMFT